LALIRRPKECDDLLLDCDWSVVSPFLNGQYPFTEPLGKFLLSFHLLELGEISVTDGHVFGCGYNVGVNDVCMIDGSGGKLYTVL
jgi:hypothetical protein